MQQQPFLKAQDVAPQLGLSTGRVYQLIQTGEIPHVRIGNAIRITREDWQTFLRTKQSEARRGRTASVKT